MLGADSEAMLHTVTETVLSYEAADFTEWSSGRRERWVTGEVPAHVSNQPTYHFGEYFVLADYAKRGWAGHRFYALGDWEPRNPKLVAGRADVARCFPKNLLARFRRARVECGRATGAGEPDLFLFAAHGQTLFLEVKMKSDRVSGAQLECLVQIRGILRSEIGIVYLRETRQSYKPKRYELDLSTFSGKRVDA